MNRIALFTQDIVLLTGKSESYARKEIQKLKKFFKKEQHQKVTIKEYCTYYGFDYQEVVAALSQSKVQHAF